MDRVSLRRCVAVSCFLLVGALSLTVSTMPRAVAAPGASMPPPPAPQAPPIVGVNDPRNPLHLTADQQQKFIAERLKLRTEGLNLMADKSLTKDQQNKKFTDLQAATMKNMRAILTPTQLAAADKQEALGKRIMGMRQQAGQQYQALKQQLTATITPDQKAKLLAIDKAARQQSMAIATSKTLSPAQKQAKIMQLRQTYAGKMHAALNKPVQQRLIQQMLQLETQEQTAETQAAHQ